MISHNRTFNRPRFYSRPGNLQPPCSGPIHHGQTGVQRNCSVSSDVQGRGCAAQFRNPYGGLTSEQPLHTVPAPLAGIPLQGPMGMAPQTEPSPISTHSPHVTYVETIDLREALQKYGPGTFCPYPAVVAPVCPHVVSNSYAHPRRVDVPQAVTFDPNIVWLPEGYIEEAYRSNCMRSYYQQLYQQEQRRQAYNHSWAQHRTEFTNRGEAYNCAHTEQRKRKTTCQDERAEEDVWAPPRRRSRVDPPEELVLPDEAMEKLEAMPAVLALAVEMGLLPASDATPISCDWQI